MVRCANSARGLYAPLRRPLHLTQLQRPAASAAYSTSLQSVYRPASSRCGRRPLLPSLTDNARQTGRLFSQTQTADDTIYALSSAHGKAGIAVIRISGPACEDIYTNLCPFKPIPKPRFAGVRTLVHPGSVPPSIVDSDAVVLYLPGPKTVTGDDVLELHVHGGNATVKAVLSAIPASRSVGAIRYAEPGEFTKRAFLNDRLDLAQVESLGDTLSAETEQQRRAAVLGNSGALGRTYEEWRQKLLLARAEIEAIIDFSEDQQFDESPAQLLANVSRLAEEMLQSIELHETASERTELLRKGIRIALVGPPNAGKSSLMNQVVGREASIVSGEAGTTRDIVEAHLDIRGYLCTFADTAGFRSHEASGVTESAIGAVEREGIRRARTKALESNIVVVLASVEKEPSGRCMIRYDQETIDLLAIVGKGIVVINKRDVVPPDELDQLVDDFQAAVLDDSKDLVLKPILVSCKEAQSRVEASSGGLHHVVDSLASLFGDMTSLPADQQDLHGVTQRQRQLLIRCRRHLEDFVGNTASDGEQDGESAEINFVVAAEDLRHAANCLARITGRGETGSIEEVLGVIFEK